MREVLKIERRIYDKILNKLYINFKTEDKYELI